MSARFIEPLRAAAENGYAVSRNPYCWTSNFSDAYVLACRFHERGQPLGSLHKSRGHSWIANGARCRVAGCAAAPDVVFDHGGPLS